jgi:hypothetical protein
MRGSANLTLMFGIIAAALALTAAIVRYASDGEVRWSLIAAAVFILAFSFGAKGRGSRQ